MSTYPRYQRTYGSINNSKVFAYYNDKLVGEIDPITYSVTREMAPIYTWGNTPAAFSRGKRGIAGEIVFKYLDKFSEDEIVPPFDVRITMYDEEYNQSATMGIYGVEILNEGDGVSFDSIEAYKARAFVAKKISSIQPK